jgi:NAD(P)-dependent dehydrogenase (short-subunit alcohol dehydrogenase family)
MFHKGSAEAFASVIRTNLLGSAQVAAACARVMREGGHGRIVLVASTAGLHGEPTVSAYAASKGAIIALGRSIAVEGAPRGVFTNVLLPYALTQMTDQGMDPRHRALMEADAVAPIAAALCDPRCTLNGEVIVAAGGGLRVAASVEWGTVPLPGAGDLAPAELADLLERSRKGPAHQYAHAQDAFQDFAAELIS